MDRSCSGDLDMTSAKRKAPPSPAMGLLGASPEERRGTPPPSLGCGLGCSPAMSSPAMGAWTLHAGAGIDDSGGCEDRHTDTAESARGGKALRLCSAPTTQALAAAPAGSDPGTPPAGEPGQSARPASCQPGAGVSGLAPCSLPPSLYRSYYHAGCCSRLSSASSLTELEAAAAAVMLSSSSDCSDAELAATPAAAAAGDAESAAAAHAADTAGAAAGCAAHHAPSPAPTPMSEDLPPEVTAAGLAAAASRRPQPLSWPPHSVAAGGSEAQLCQVPLSPRDRPPGVEASYWHDIPDDIMKRVLERLQPSTLRVLRLVCRGWEAAASRLLRHLRPESVVGKNLSRRFPALHSLDLSNAAMGVDFATPRALRLQSLLLDDHLAELAGLHRLEQLSLRGCSCISGMGLAQLGRLRSLAMLNLSNCAGLRNECLAAVAAAVPRLATLNLQGCSRLGDDGIAHLVALPLLRHLLLPAGITDASMPALLAMPALERVALRGCARVTTAGICMLLQRPGLKRVVISKCPQLSLEALCAGGGSGMGELEGARLVTAEAAVVAQAAAAASAGGLPAVPGMGGQDMQLLVGDA